MRVYIIINYVALCLCLHGCFSISLFLTRITLSKLSILISFSLAHCVFYVMDEFVYGVGDMRNIRLNDDGSIIFGSGSSNRCECVEHARMQERDIERERY